jgi:hypothetical protein
MKRCLIICCLTLLPLSAHAIPGKDFNQCVDNADKRYDESRKFCYEQAGGFDRQSCLAIADRHRQDREENCKAVEMVHESLNPNLNVHVGFGSQEPKKEPTAQVPAPQLQVPYAWEQQAPTVLPPNPGATYMQQNSAGFGDFMKKVLGK